MQQWYQKTKAEREAYLKTVEMFDRNKRPFQVQILKV